MGLHGLLRVGIYLFGGSGGVVKLGFVIPDFVCPEELIGLAKWLFISLQKEYFS
jgi:hypothetical protein